MDERELFELEPTPLLWRGAEFVVRALPIGVGAQMAAAKSKLAREAIMVSEALHWKVGPRVFTSANRVLELSSLKADLIEAVKAKLRDLASKSPTTVAALDSLDMPPKVDTSPMPVPPVPPGLDLEVSK